MEGGGQPVLSFEQCFILFSSFPLLLAFDVGGLGFEFCVFVAGWRHALRSEWPFIIIINIITCCSWSVWRHSAALAKVRGSMPSCRAVAFLSALLMLQGSEPMMAVKMTLRSVSSALVRCLSASLSQHD